MKGSRLWGDEEDAYLRSHRQDSATEIAAHLGRTRGAVQYRRLALGLTRIGKPKRLTVLEVAEIRAALADDTYGIGSRVARQFQISRSTVEDIRKGKCWRHV